MQSHIAVAILGVLTLVSLVVLNRFWLKRYRKLEGALTDKIEKAEAENVQLSRGLADKSVEFDEKLTSLKEVLSSDFSSKIQSLKIDEINGHILRLESGALKIGEVYGEVIEELCEVRTTSDTGIEELGARLDEKVKKDTGKWTQFQRQFKAHTEAFEKLVARLDDKVKEDTGKWDQLGRQLEEHTGVSEELAARLDAKVKKDTGKWAQFQRQLKEQAGALEDLSVKAFSSIEQVGNNLDELVVTVDTINLNAKAADKIISNLKKENSALASNVSKLKSTLTKSIDGNADVASKLEDQIGVIEGLVGTCMENLENHESSLGDLNQKCDESDLKILDKVKEVNKTLEGSTIDLRRELKEVDTQFKLLIQKHSKAEKVETKKVADNLSKLSNKLDKLVGGHEKRLDDLVSKTAGMSSLRKLIDSVSKNLNEEKLNFENILEDLNRDRKNEKQRISRAMTLGRESLSGYQMFFRSRYEEDKIKDPNTIKRLKKYDDSVQKLGFMHGQIYQRFNRLLDLEKISELIEEFDSKLGLKLTADKLAYMADRIWLIESSCAGRLATNVEDEIIRCLIASHVGKKGLRGMEIGSLFGINVCCLKELVADHCDSFQLTVIDPLEGYYAKQPNDILVDEPINERVFHRNINRYCEEGDVTLIKEFTNDLTRKSIKGQFNYILIDGDHTYDGVKVDFALIRNMVVPGGYIIFDDYDTEHWPDVKKFVDSEVLKLKGFKKVFSMYRTCVVQKLPVKARKAG